MESSGARLKKIRLEKRLTLEEVRKQTKIHLNILKAIEEDSLISLNPIYTRGFLKIYCKFLGVDPKDYIAGYQEPQIPVIVKQVSATSKKTASFIKTAYVKLNLGSLKATAKKFKTVFVFILIIIFVSIVLFNLGKITSSKRKVIQKSPSTLKQSQHPEAVAPKKEVSSGIRLGIRAKDDCWVHLKVDGRVVFHTVLKKGKFETWQAKDRIELSLGNAGGVELELNSKPIPALGRRGQVIKNISITKERGLEVSR